MNKFKVGDKVRVVSYKRSLSVDDLTVTDEMRRIVGLEYEVAKVDSRDDTVRLHHVHWWYHVDDLELVARMSKFEVGDTGRRTTRDNGHLAKIGQEATILSVHPEDPSVHVDYAGASLLGERWSWENCELVTRSQPTPTGKKIYVIGSLRNPEVLAVHRTLQQALPEVEVFSSWLAAGEHADDAWRDYEQALGRTYKEALDGYAAKHVFAFDKHHLDTSDAAVLVLPAGRSGHLELGYMAGKGKVTAILMDDPERWDVMVQFADVLADSTSELVEKLRWKLKD